MAKLWGGRFKKATDPAFERFSSSFRSDIRLLPYELEVDRAHVRALRGCRVLTTGEERRLLGALNSRLKLDPRSEDIHTAVHEAVRKKVGALADKLHTARSRNELVSQSTRLYGKEHAAKLHSLVRELQRQWLRLAERHQNVMVPAMTHLQKAQVLSLAHICLAYVEMFERARMRLEQGVIFCDVCVLGSGALAGVTFPLNQKKIMRELKLARIVRNSYDIAGERDFLMNLLSCCAFLGTQLSRIAEDLSVDKTRQGSWWDIPAEFCTGSSMMPHKKNPDLIELTRGAAGIFIGNLHGFLVTLKGLPTSYNRDLQWDKKFLFDSIETMEGLLEAFIRMTSRLRVASPQQIKKNFDDSLYTTDLADYLVKKRVPFGTAHKQVGQIVVLSESKKVSISKIGLDLLKKIAPAIDGDVYDLFDADHSVRLKKTIGSTHPAEIKKQIARWKKELRHA